MIQLAGITEEGSVWRRVLTHRRGMGCKESGDAGQFRCANPCGQSGKGGGQDHFKPSARAPAHHDLVNPGGRNPLECEEGREAGLSVLDCSM